MIKRATFNHGWWYSYCVNKHKAEILAGNGFSALHSYLHSMFDNCPHPYFLEGPRGSKLKFALGDLNIKHHDEHVMSKLTRHALEINAERYKGDHLKVQMFMLENDTNTVAIEVPVWLMPEEFGKYSARLKGNIPLTGHIDLLKIEGGKIWIWDYKPCASQEKYAATQTYFYALMLSRRTGIPIENFMCGWFDSANAYTFKPIRKDLDDFEK